MGLVCAHRIAACTRKIVDMRGELPRTASGERESFGHSFFGCARGLLKTHREIANLHWISVPASIGTTLMTEGEMLIVRAHRQLIDDADSNSVISGGLR